MRLVVASNESFTEYNVAISIASATASDHTPAMNGSLLPGTVLAGILTVSFSATSVAQVRIPPATERHPITTKVRTGTTPNVFETVPLWGTLPEGKTHGPSQGGIAVDREGYVYASNDVRGIDVFSAAGQYVRTIAPKFAGTLSLTIHEEKGIEYLYGAHIRNLRAFKMTLQGRPTMLLYCPTKSGLYAQGTSEYRPASVAVAPDGSIFVADVSPLNVIHKYSARGEYLLSFGGKGDQPGELHEPHGITVDTRYDPPLLLVCDRKNYRLQHFDLEGHFVQVVAKALGRPSSTAIYGEFVAIAERDGCVTVLDGENRLVTRLGSNDARGERGNFRLPKEAWRAGLFAAPHGVAWDASGNLYVQEWSTTGRLTKLALVDR